MSLVEANKNWQLWKETFTERFFHQGQWFSVCVSAGGFGREWTGCLRWSPHARLTDPSDEQKQVYHGVSIFWSTHQDSLYRCCHTHASTPSSHCPCQSSCHAWSPWWRRSFDGSSLDLNGRCFSDSHSPLFVPYFTRLNLCWFQVVLNSLERRDVVATCPQGREGTCWIPDHPCGMVIYTFHFETSWDVFPFWCFSL